MPPRQLNHMLSAITADPWRQQVSFSADFSEVNARICEANTDDDASKLLNDWLQRSQPCLFGRLAAKSNQLSFCILRESDLLRDDNFIRDKIQDCRTSWTREALDGKKSGFIILAISAGLSLAIPNAAVAAIAHRLAELYLLDDIKFDHVHMDEVFLEQPGRGAAIWRWDAGINYFASHGDKRWWHDHRIPGGIGFSVNSVGHMVRSGLMQNALTHFEDLMGTSDIVEKRAKIESLSKALELAMTTIDRAADAVSGKATFLLPLPPNSHHEGPFPVLPDHLADKHPCEYFGYYHTDFTLPTEYFIPDVERPLHLAGHSLDFTYLFDARIDNPAYMTMGTGRRIRDWNDSEERDAKDAYRYNSLRITKVIPTSIPISEVHRLKHIRK